MKVEERKKVRGRGRKKWKTKQKKCRDMRRKRVAILGKKGLGK